VGSFENLLFKNHLARIAHVYMKAIWYIVDLNLFKSWSLGVRRGHNTENHIYICLQYIEELSSPEPTCQFQSNLVQIILGYREFKIIQIKGQILFKGEMIRKVQK
jgi:hypothetical protein